MKLYLLTFNLNLFSLNHSEILWKCSFASKTREIPFYFATRMEVSFTNRITSDGVTAFGRSLIYRSNKIGASTLLI